MPFRDPVKTKEYQQAYRASHKEEINARNKRWHSANPEYNKEHHRKWYAKNRARKNASTKAWRVAVATADPVKWRRSRKNTDLKSAYGITLADYELMLKSQGGKCAICRSPDSKSPSKYHSFFVDHDHANGKVRGLLCFNCNSALGLMRDSQRNLVRAIEYLRRNKS